LASYVCLSISDLSSDEEHDLATQIGSIKHFRRTGAHGYSLRVEVLTPHAEDAIGNLRAILEEHGDLRSLVRRRDAQLSIVLEGSDGDGFPSLAFSADMVSFLSDLGVSIDVDLYCVNVDSS